MTGSSEERKDRARLPARWSRLLGLVALLGAVAATGACRSPDSTPAPGAHATVIVTAHHANELAPVLGQPDLDRLRGAGADPDVDDAVAYVVAAGRPDAETVDLEPRRRNGQIEHGPRRDALVDGRLAEVAAAVDRAATGGGDVDLLAALGVAAQTHASTVLVLSSGLSTTDPLDMRVSGWDRDPLDLARDLHRRGLLPDLRGRTAVFSGLGRTAGAQPALGLREQAQLRDQWLAICTAAGALCSTEDAVRPATPPVSRLVPPVVEVPSVTTTPGPAGTTTVSVPAALLFGPDSCAVLGAAETANVLEPLLERLRGGGVTVSISGRTAPVGPGDGVGLAACRAHRAADLLRSLGVPETAIAGIRGDGSLRDPSSAARDEQGRLDPTKLAALRRVVFTVSPVKEIR